MQMRRSSFFERYAIWVLCGIFFLVPFALRGARLALEQMRNDVKDWLPDDFAETSELDWFRDHFLGEQFVLISWDGCTEEDQRLELLSRLLVPPPISEEAEDDKPLDHRQPDFVGDELGLYYPENDHENWGGKNEKWLQGNRSQWYYILENGEIYKWNGKSTVLGALGRLSERIFTGGNSIGGDYIKKVDEYYYEKPRYLQARLFKSVTTGPEVLATLAAPGGTLVRDDDPTPEELAEAHEKALKRLTGTLFGPDGKQTCLIVTLTEAGKVDLRRTMGHGVLGRPEGQLLKIAEQAGIPPEELRLGGPPVDNVSIDEEGERTLANLVSFSVIIGLGLSYICLRSIKLTIMVFFVGGISAVASLSLVWWTAGTFIWWLDPTTDAVMMSMPAVVYVLGLSGAIHIVNYYRDVVKETGTLHNAPELTIAHGWRPCTIAAVTTAVGLGSLATSSITPIHKFGIFSAMGVLATLFLLFTYLPAALQMWPPDPAPKKGDKPKVKEPSAAGVWIRGLGNRIGDYVIAHNVKVALGCMAVFLFFAFGLQYLKTSVQLLKMFDDDARIIQDYAWLEGNLGKLVPMELVVRVEPEVMYYSEREEGQPFNPTAAELTEKVDEKFQYNFLERMEMAGRVANVVEEYLGPDGAELVGPTMSALTFAPELPEAAGDVSGAWTRRTYSGRLEDSFNEFVGSDYLRVDKENGAELWRVSLRLGALENIDYGNFVTDLKKVTEPIMDAYQARDRLLRKIDEDNNGEGYATAKVAILGSSYLQERDEEAKSPEVAADDVGQPHKTYDHQGATKVFAETLTDLLVNAKLDLLDFDPEINTEKRLDYILKNFDYVVLVEPNEMYDMDAIAKQVKGAFDVTNHEYNGKEIPRMYDPNRPPVSLVYTGVVPVVYKAARTLLSNLIESTVWAFVLIALVMSIVLKSVRAGLVSMLPNVFPICVVFGYMSWMGMEVDIGTMMTASVAMGVAVDDTVHFLTWFRWGLDEGYTRAQAIKEAYSRCALAMFQTTIVGGIGLAVFALSTFTPTQRFGYLMVSLLAVALVGDLLFLPALLAGPLGKIFRPGHKARDKRDDDGDQGSAETESTSDESSPSMVAEGEESDEPRVYPVHGRSRPA
ncbi:hypothetical protein C5Y93_10310 [Blastopirellula marina]|uniref:SSD domain-containing protein n=2 Tax=Blastopirellula marina TaxID=124 RepID=A0A2S8GPL0_9BACT|nr:hypothetical protein C5Y93_10310 [Blastopirellula marina]